MSWVSDLGEYDVVVARMKTRALIEETEPVLHDLEQQLALARDLLSRIEQEEGGTDGA